MLLQPWKPKVRPLYADESEAPTGYEITDRDEKSAGTTKRTAGTDRGRPGSASRWTHEQAALMSARNEERIKSSPRKSGWVHTTPLTSFRFKGTHNEAEKSAWLLIRNDKHVHSKAAHNEWFKNLSVNPPKAKTPDHEPWRDAGRRHKHSERLHPSQRQTMVAL